jgi:hypothetical protein
MGSIRSAATVLALILITMGVGYLYDGLYDAIARGNAAISRTMAAGTGLCCLSLAVLYLAGTRVEK